MHMARQARPLPELPLADPADARGLAAVLMERLRGEVRFDDGSRALYATDASNYRQVPIGVVVPRDGEDVERTLEAARRFGAPILCRGGGTSLAGQCCNVAVVLDFSKYLHRVIRIDADQRLGAVEAGCVLDDLRDAAASHGLTFGPDPATHSHCTLGGMLGNNSCGIHSLLSANHGLGQRTSDNTHELEILTYRGDRLRVGPTSETRLQQIIAAGGAQGRLHQRLKDFRDKWADEIRDRYPRLPRRVSGYNLDELLPENGFHVARSLVGSEGTLATILSATMHLVPRPQARVLVVLGYPQVFAAADDLLQVLEYRPTGLEGIDRRLFEWVKAEQQRGLGDVSLLPEGDAFLFIEFSGDSQDEARQRARECMAGLRRSGQAGTMKLYAEAREQQELWDVREAGLGATAWVPGHPDTWPGWEDSAVPPEKMSDYLRALRELMEQFDYHPALYGHFGQGCVHCRVEFDLVTEEGIQRYRSFAQRAADLVVRFGGSLSGEHGDGQSRAELLPKMFGPRLVEAFREFKSIWDPDGKMNPGKVVAADSLTSNLRLGTNYDPPEMATEFRYPEDQGSFGRAALRCVGVGKCRRESGGVMCPSYKVTREEKHSTRGRARMLWEMLHGEVIRDGWHSEAVKESLDLCLSCKGCKSDCPVQVDMATYKAEFLAHYYQNRLRPRHAYAMGWIYWWARLASLAPRMANFVGQTPIVRAVFKALGGIAPHRQVPRFALRTFRQTHVPRRPDSPRPNGPVILWPDTFNNHFFPDSVHAAVDVLEYAGFEVFVPRVSLCCGRPLYDFGMLDTARRLLTQVLQHLRREIRAGIPVVFLEPSCHAVFRDELINLFPHDEDARRLSQQSLLLSELLTQRAEPFEIPSRGGRAIVHGHCHHKSLTGMDSEQQVLDQLGLDVQTPEPGCCGMAGAFGFEPGEHYEVSVACGEQALAPAVRDADEQTLIIANGFSCREQIRQLTGRQPLHLSQVLQRVLQDQGQLRPGSRPAGQSHWRASAIAFAAGALLAGAWLWRSTRP